MRVLLLNSFSLNMLTINPKKVLSIELIDIEALKDILQAFEDFESYIGHADTAHQLTKLLEVEVKTNRSNVNLCISDLCFVAQYKGPRLPEGTVTLPEGARFEFYQVAILDNDDLIAVLEEEGELK